VKRAVQCSAANNARCAGWKKLFDAEQAKIAEKSAVKVAVVDPTRLTGPLVCFRSRREACTDTRACKQAGRSSSATCSWVSARRTVGGASPSAPMSPTHAPPARAEETKDEGVFWFNEQHYLDDDLPEDEEDAPAAADAGDATAAEDGEDEPAAPAAAPAPAAKKEEKPSKEKKAKPKPKIKVKTRGGTS
jgi:hypothetical protein